MNIFRLIPIAATTLFLSLAILTLLPDRGYAAEQYTLKIANIAPEGSVWGDMAVKLKMYVESRSRGRLKLIWYMAGVIGEDEPDIVKKIDEGQLHGSIFTIIGLGRVQPAVRVVVLPFLIRNYEEADYVLDSLSPDFQRLFVEKGYEFLGFTEVGFSYLYTQSPIHTTDDLGRLNMWTWEGDQLLEGILHDVGITHTFPSPLFQGKADLESGRVNAYYNTLYGQLVLGWYQHAKYLSSFTFGYCPCGWLIKKDVFENLPADLQTILKQASELIFQPIRDMIRTENYKAREGLIKRGMVVYEYPPEVLDEIKRKSHAGYFEYAGKEYPLELLEKTMQKLKEFRSRN